MTSTYPTALDTVTTFPGDIDGAENSDALGAADVDLDDLLNDLGGAVRALQAKVGIDASAVITSLDYLVKQAADPGHSHTATPVHEHDAAYVNEGDHTKAAHDALNIDADTLDGNDATAFAAASHAHTDLATDAELAALDGRVDDLVARTYYVGPGADDYATVQAAIDAAHAEYLDSGARGIVFVGGSFTSAKVTLKQGVARLTGYPNYSRMMLANSSDTALLTTDGFVTTDSNAGLYGFEVSDLIFDGNKANQASNADQAVAQVYGYNYRFVRNIIRNAKTWGYYSNWSSQSDPPGPDGRGMEAVVEDVSCVLYDTGGIDFVGPHDSFFNRVLCSDLTGSGGTTGIRMGARSYGTELHSCHPYGNGHDYALDIDSTIGIQVSGGQYEGAQSGQIRVKDSSNCDIRGAKLYAAGTIAAPVGIEIDESTTVLTLGNKLENLTSGCYKFTGTDGGSHTLKDWIYQDSGAVVAGTPAVNVNVAPLDVYGSVTAAPGSSVTVASGILTFAYGQTFQFVNGEGSASDTVTNIRPTGRTGSEIRILANHELTFSHAAGADGQIITPDGGNYVVAQFRMARFVCTQGSPSTWVVEA